jgi:hypothetical protein
MNITVTIAPSPELLQSMQSLANALKGISPSNFPIEIPPVSAVLPASEEQAEKPVATSAVKKAKTATVASEPQEEVKVSVEAIREMVSAKLTAGKKAEVKKLLAEFEVATVSLLSPTDYTAFYQKLTHL